jgi:hypothetical protein
MSAAKRHAALLDARRQMSALLALPDGATILVDGKPMQKQPYSCSEFAHPDSKSLLQVGYGPGRYNAEISVSRIADGYVKVEAAA